MWKGIIDMAVSYNSTKIAYPKKEPTIGKYYEYMYPNLLSFDTKKAYFKILSFAPEMPGAETAYILLLEDGNTETKGISFLRDAIAYGEIKEVPKILGMLHIREER